jgi:structural maintenance of chromosome 3 (chondroitin sulfate proteoglycan 6)
VMHSARRAGLILRELWREDGKLGQTVANARDQLGIHERTLQGTMDKVSEIRQALFGTDRKDTANGLRAVRRYAQQLQLDGVYGPLYELFEVSDRYKTAVEVTAGNRLVSCLIQLFSAHSPVFSMWLSTTTIPPPRFSKR